MRASVIVDNHNYAQFLNEAIDSALAQTHAETDVIVVDDGSTDGSRAIIEAYEDRVTPVFKENGGQASAFNAGFAVSSADVVLFLDADDVLLPTAVAEAVKRFAPGVTKVHWPLWEIDGEGRRSGRVAPDNLAAGDLRQVVLREGPASHVNPPTSGNAWARDFLERVLPVPEQPFRTWADTYLLELAPLFGPLACVPEPQSLYRIHGQNSFAARPFVERLQISVDLYDHVCDALADHARSLGHAADAEVYRKQSWPHRVARAVDDLLRVVPRGEGFALVDEDEWGVDDELDGRPRLPFPERDGVYWGVPEDDDAALAELARLSKRGVRFVVVAWTAFWWLEHLPRFRDELHRGFRQIVGNDGVLVFEAVRT